MNLCTDFNVISTDDAFLAGMDFDFSKSKFDSFELQQINMMTLMHTDDDGILHYLHPSAFSAKANSEDIPNWNEAMNGEDSAGFYKAMEAELETLESMECWGDSQISNA